MFTTTRLTFKLITTTVTGQNRRSRSVYSGVSHSLHRTTECSRHAGRAQTWQYLFVLRSMLRGQRAHRFLQPSAATTGSWLWGRTNLSRLRHSFTPFCRHRGLFNLLCCSGSVSCLESSVRNFRRFRVSTEYTGETSIFPESWLAAHQRRSSH